MIIIKMNKKILIILSLLINFINVRGLEIPLSVENEQNIPVVKLHIHRLIEYVYIQFVNDLPVPVKVTYGERKSHILIHRNLTSGKEFFFEGEAENRLHYGELENRIIVYIHDGYLWNTKKEFSLGEILTPILMQEKDELEVAHKQGIVVTQKGLAERYSHSLITLRLQEGPNKQYVLNPSIRKVNIR